MNPRPPSDERQPRFELADFGSQLAGSFIAQVVVPFGVAGRKLVAHCGEGSHDLLLQRSVLTTYGHGERLVIEVDFVDGVGEALGSHDGADGTLVIGGLEGGKVIGILALDLVALFVGDVDHAG